MRRAVAAGLLAVLVVAAGCVGGIGGSPTQAAGSDGDATDGGATDGDATDGAASDTGTVEFYVSDRPNDMDDFEHLNVTVTAVRFHLVDPDDDGPGAEADGERDDEGEDGRWVVREVNATTVDLTRLRGANATLVERFDLPAGEYDQVFLEVSATNGTLTDGGSTEVKLPSERLKLDQQFVVGNGEEVDFVFDVTVHRAGNSGKYILRPVASESGTEAPIERVDDDDDRDAEGDLRVRFTGSLNPGENATVRVTDRGDAVASATVSVDGAADGTTNTDGEYTFAVPADAEELEVEVTTGELEGELEREFDDGDDGDDGDDERGNGEGQGNGS
jgi:hypothetical protein